MRCLRCGNCEDKYFYQDGNVWYCRKCIAFGRINVNELPTRTTYTQKKQSCRYELEYPLTKKQKEASQKVCYYTSHHCSVLVYALCGAGKTEIVMEVISQYLNKGKKVGFAISRRQVVLEIQARLQEAFSMLSVIAVCEGHTDVVDGDLIVCTMHQLHRYYQTFDLLIMDEVDAFPYRGNTVLQHIAQHASCGEIVYLTATPDDDMLEMTRNHTLQLVELFQRPHGHALIEPTIHVCGRKRQFFYLLRFLREQHKEKQRTLVFVPTIAHAKKLYAILKYVYPCIAFTSKSEQKEEIIAAFHAGKYEFLITTTILERGITMKGIHIIVMEANHAVFNEASLTQMIGRVGRNFEIPDGKGVFLCSKKNKEILRCQQAIVKMNARD